MYIPALEDELEMEVSKNESENKMWLLLYPEDYQNFIRDKEGNVGILVNNDQAKEVKRIAEEIIEYTSEE